MKLGREERIKRILADYHPVVEPGEESMTLEEAKRMIKGLIAHGHSEEEAFDCLKYCTVGEDYVESWQREKKHDELTEHVSESGYYAKMALKKVGHFGLLLLALNALDVAKRKEINIPLTKGLFAFAAVMYLLDDVDLLVHEFNGLKRIKKK